jgi:ABC-type multidrug transport system ATPase subunit
MVYADRIGDPDHRRGISGGQRKRVNVAMELVLDPSVLFLDEPTTGLDSASAFDLTQALKLLAESRNLTIAAVIHQPSTKVILFDRKHIFLTLHISLYTQILLVVL